MRISDWSSDVCSSDLAIISPIGGVVPLVMRRRYQPAPRRSMDERARKHLPPHMIADAHHRHDREHEAEHRSEEHTSELQSLMRISYAVFCLKKKNTHISQRQHASNEE